jgi:hypothetical protein
MLLAEAEKNLDEKDDIVVMGVRVRFVAEMRGSVRVRKDMVRLEG